MPGKTSICGKLIVLALALACTLGAGPDGPGRKDLEQKLRDTFVGKGATLRRFYKDSDLAFDGNGHLLHESKTGPWTYYGRIQISSLRFSGDTILFRGSRNVVQWEATAGEFNNYTLDDQPVKIAIHLGSGFTEDSVFHAIDSVFLTRDTRLSDVAPAYWKEILTTERERRAEFDKEKAEDMKNVVPAGTDIVPPKLLSRSEGVETSLSPFTEVLATSLILSYVVDENGQVKLLEIEKPIGLGIDDPVAELISHWKYEPATKDGHPVAVVMHAKFVYKASKGHIDPYHTLPCPRIENVFAC